MDPALAIFGMLLGQCWAAEVAPQTLDTHCFADLWNGSHVRDRHSVTRDGKAIYGRSASDMAVSAASRTSCSSNEIKRSCGRVEMAWASALPPWLDGA